MPNPDNKIASDYHDDGQMTQRQQHCRHCFMKERSYNISDMIWLELRYVQVFIVLSLIQREIYDNKYCIILQ